MEDITKYIVLLGFVPVIVFLIFAFWNDFEELFTMIVVAIILILCFGGFIWGITTLGRLL